MPTIYRKKEMYIGTFWIGEYLITEQYKKSKYHIFRSVFQEISSNIPKYTEKINYLFMTNSCIIEQLKLTLAYNY